uniref:Centrosomal protein 43 n=1 Tax=Arion vulgaris TaxID=1028688 RepID=A0A0B7A799_9EUPU
MSADEDTELRDLVAQTLETNGTLGKLRAQLRASVFLALEDQEKGQNKAPYLNKELRSFLATGEGKLTASLVQEFLEFFGLEFTLAVFKPETGLNEQVKRADLLKELNILPSNAPSNAPLLTCLLSTNKTSADNTGSGDGVHVAKHESYRDLSEKQISDARNKFEFYDKDSSGAIDKDELRNLFHDMFPSFHRNMLERYVNDEFNAADRNFSSSIDFNEFLGMYKRLFLLCRTVVASDVDEILSPSNKPELKKISQEQQLNPVITKSSPAPPKVDSHSNNVTKHSIHSVGEDFGGYPEEDPFFDDIPAPGISFNTLSSFITERSRPSFLSELEKNKQMPRESKLNGADTKGKQPGSSMSSLDGLPALTSGRGLGTGPLAGAPPLSQIKPSTNDSLLNDSEIDKNLRAIDKRMLDLGLDSQNEEFEYEEDFIQDRSLSQKTASINSKSNGKVENGSVAEEIDDEEIEDISIEADDLSRSEKSGFDGHTTDCSISQIGGFDYAEDPILP